jgi:hypothetical protein
VSLADKVTARIVADKPPAILTVDIERVPGRFRIEGYRGSLDIEGDFWDLGQYRRMIYRRIEPDEVLEWPRTVCLAWRWYGNKRVEFAAEWQPGGFEGMLRKAWDLFDRADMTVGHNVDRFDEGNLRGEWMTLGLTPPSPVRPIDTLKHARTTARLESYKLDSLLKRFGVGGKTDKYSVKLARAAVTGDREAQRTLRAYNVGDIEASETLYDYIRPWIKNHPHLGLYTGDEDCCGHCAGGTLEPSGWAHTAVTAYAQYRCKNCGAWYRKTHIKARTTTRAAR